MITANRLRLSLVLALAAACGEPGNIPQTASPSSVVSAVFDPVAGNIPLPNDLVLNPVPTTVPPAQQDLLNVFAAQHGFPNDQEVPVTISFQRTSIAADGSTTNSAPTLDTATLNAGTLAVFLQTPQGQGTVALDPVTDADYVNAGDHGVLTLHNKGRQPWTPGIYVVALRGGTNGLKTKEGDPINASSTFYLIAQGQNLETDQGILLLQAQLGSHDAAVAAAQQLDQIINAYSAKGGAFDAVNTVFPHQELAAMTTFPIAGYGTFPGNPPPRPPSPLVTQVELDPGRGLVPLPIDLLRDPRPASPSCAACGKLTPLAACTLAQGTLDASGVCRNKDGTVNAAAPGFAALDGFATTGAMLAPTSDLLVAASITPTTVQLWDLSNPALPVKVDATTYLTQPVEVTQQGLAQAVVLQPASATASDATSVFHTRPLKDATDYAVVISNGVKDKTGTSIGPGTVAHILQFTHPLVDAAGKSQLQGVDDATAGALELMRQKLTPVLAASGFGSGNIAMAYTFRTQTILSTATQLGALPYNPALPPATALPGTVTALAPTAAFAKYGVDPAIPSSNINEVLETTLTTFNLLDPASGAFNSSGTTAPETINAMVVTPKTAPACAGPLTPFGKCAPLVIFRHGLGRGRVDVLTVADSFAAKGFVTVAIDAAKHGDRSFCTSNQATITIGGVTVPQCVTGVSCTTALPPGAQGDTNPPGTCANDPANFFKQPVSAVCAANPVSCGYDGTHGIPVVSSNYLISANFFRSRDTFRQDIIDQSQLVRAIVFTAPAPPPTGHTVFDHMVAQGLIIDPTPGKVYFAGQSLGSIQGAADVAANPRISRAVLNVGGGTVVDTFTTSPAFASTVNALLAGLGIQPGTAAYLQFLVVAKTILDPADPVNFAGHLQSNTLQNLLGPPFDDGTGHQTPKVLLTQAAFCDQVVPNPWNFILDSTAGTGPFPIDPTFGTPGTFQLFFTGTPTPTALASCPTPTSTSANAIPHGFFTNWTASTATAQSDAASFLLDPAANKPPSLRTF
jgi:hypothetical protein